jgi:hypothetical protein
MYVSILALAVAPLYALKTQANADVVAAITKLENDAVKADLAADKSWSEKYLAEDWMGCDSSGKWFTKADVLKMLADPKTTTTRAKVSNLKVRVYGTTAVATYTDSYEGTGGQHRVRTILATDVFVKMDAD